VIVVTGGTGHLGQWVIQALTANGHEVACLARSPCAQPTIMGVTWSRRVRTIRCDLTDTANIAAIRDLLAEAEAVVHLAAFVPRDTAQNAGDDADATLSVNVHGTVALLNALAEAPRLGSFVYSSTFEVYGDPKAQPVDEEHPTEPLGYYGASKLCGEGYAQLAAKASGFPCTILRLPAIYGPGDRIVRALGNFIRAAVAEEPLEIHGDGADRRELVYAGDAADAVVRAVEKQSTGVFNVASGRGYSIRELAETVRTVAGDDSLVLQRERTKPRADYVLNITKARRELCWEPRTSLTDGIRAQMEWIRMTA
jgi:UDP-glucose 4-epimerase